jgi:serine/threonine-protein kinase RsbW
MTVYDQFEVTIPSVTSAGEAIQERILNALNDLEYSARDVFGVRLALEEALVNAIKHGNGMDPDKSVRIACEVSGEQVRIEIQDEGPGFIPDELDDPTEDENLDRPGGRGIMLMRAFMSSVIYNQIGNHVTLIKIKGAAPDDEDE